MNFFAHALIASRLHNQPRFVLGAMLPDLASMAALRLETVENEEIAAGVALHHETDRIFHANSVFRALCESALNQLEAAGVGRGAARAVGHVGSALLLDGVLSHDAPAREAYASAIAIGCAPGFTHEVRFKPSPVAAPLQEWFEWLADGPLPEAYREVDFVCERLQRILSRRPRLALRPGDHGAVRAWLHRAATQVQRDVDALLALRSA